MKKDNIEWEKAVNYLEANNRESALFIFRSLYNNGFEAAARMIALIYETPSDSDSLQDYTKAKKWYEISAYDVGDIIGFIGLAKIYFYGLGVEKNNGKALDFLKSIEGNDFHIAYLLEGKILLDGINGVEYLDLAEDAFQKSYERGNIVSMFYLAKIAKLKGKYFGYLRFQIGGIVKSFTALYNNPSNEFANDV